MPPAENTPRVEIFNTEIVVNLYFADNYEVNMSVFCLKRSNLKVQHLQHDPDTAVGDGTPQVDRSSEAIVQSRDISE